MKDKKDDKTLNFVEIEVETFDEMVTLIDELRKENIRVKHERNDLAHELDKIKSMSMFEFGNRYCTSESLEADGHAFARALGVGQ